MAVCVTVYLAILCNAALADVSSTEWRQTTEKDFLTCWQAALADVSSTEWRSVDFLNQAGCTPAALADVSSTEWRNYELAWRRPELMLHLLMSVAPNGGTEHHTLSVSKL